MHSVSVADPFAQCVVSRIDYPRHILIALPRIAFSYTIKIKSMIEAISEYDIENEIKKKYT